MRLRNVKNAKTIVESSEYVIKDEMKYIGNYKKIFNNDNPIHLEIGMGKGDFIIGMAKCYPNINFIGVEKYESVMVRAIEKLRDLDLPNLKLIRMDAIEIDKVFKKEISTIYLNFSDPWPKNRHEHRRLTSPTFLKKYSQIFKGTKRIIQKTDNRKLFEYSIISYVNHGYKLNDLSLNLYQDDLKDNVPTEYEKKFVAKGQIIYKIDVFKEN